MFWNRNRGVFADPPVDLDAAEQEDARIAARDAARAARHSFASTRSRYRAYREGAGERYLDWPAWRAEFDRVYRRVGPHHAAGQSSDGGGASSGP